MSIITHTTLSSTTRVDISWITLGGIKCLKFTFIGKLTHEAAGHAAIEWANEFKKIRKDTAVPVIFDCLHMSDYHPMARTCWQKVITELKSQIRDIWVISDSKIIRAGAAILGVFTSFAIRTVDAESKISIR